MRINKCFFSRSSSFINVVLGYVKFNHLYYPLQWTGIRFLSCKIEAGSSLIFFPSFILYMSHIFSPIHKFFKHEHAQRLLSLLDLHLVSSKGLENLTVYTAQLLFVSYTAILHSCENLFQTRITCHFLLHFSGQNKTESASYI